MYWWDVDTLRGGVSNGRTKASGQIPQDTWIQAFTRRKYLQRMVSFIILIMSLLAHKLVYSTPVFKTNTLNLN